MYCRPLCLNSEHNIVNIYQVDKVVLQPSSADIEPKNLTPIMYSFSVYVSVRFSSQSIVLTLLITTLIFLSHSLAFYSLSSFLTTSITRLPLLYHIFVARLIA